MHQCSSGIYEFVFGAPLTERAALIEFWQMLGFVPIDEGTLAKTATGQIYGHEVELQSVRLVHPGCTTFGTGYVRLQLWESLADEGLGNTRPLTIGSRWMGLYTHDILQLEDAFRNAAMIDRFDLWLSPRVDAPLANPAPSHDFFTPFVGLRELLVFGKYFRLAFIQRAGFDRPGFGTFDDTLPYKNTEGSHASLVQPTGVFSTAFYKQAFDFETAPFGGEHDSGEEPATVAALNLAPGETFRIERTRAVDCPGGLLQVYSPHQACDDKRHASRPGCGNLCAYSVRVRDLDRLAATIDATSGASRGAICNDEFGTAALNFTAPDGLAWIAVADVR
ncbi:MAG: hypothetical protein AAGC71_02410 [Pseudomonadota bacterium]